MGLDVCTHLLTHLHKRAAGSVDERSKAQLLRRKPMNMVMIMAVAVAVAVAVAG